MGSGVVGVSSSLAVHAGSSLGVSTGVLSVSVEGGVEAVSGSVMSLRAGALSVSSSSSASVSTVDGVLRASGGVEGYVSEGLSVSAGGMWLRSGDALSVSSVSSARLVSGGRVVADAGEGMRFADVTFQFPHLRLAMMALLLTLIANIGVTSLVGSFRLALTDWLETRLSADIYVTAGVVLSCELTHNFSTGRCHKRKELPIVWDVIGLTNGDGANNGALPACFALKEHDQIP